MKIQNKAKCLKLKRNHIKHGIIVAKSLGVKEVAYRNFKKWVLAEAKYGRKAVIVSDYGKQYGVFLPLPIEEE